MSVRYPQSLPSVFNCIPWHRKIEKHYVRTVIQRFRSMLIGLLLCYIPASTVSTTVNPSLHTFLCVRVTTSSIP